MTFHVKCNRLFLSLRFTSILLDFDAIALTYRYVGNNPVNAIDPSGQEENQSGCGCPTPDLSEFNFPTPCAAEGGGPGQSEDEIRRLQGEETNLFRSEVFPFSPTILRTPVDFIRSGDKSRQMQVWRGRRVSGPGATSFSAKDNRSRIC